MVANFRKGENEINEILDYPPSAITIMQETYERMPASGNLRHGIEDAELTLRNLDEDLRHPQTRRAMVDFTDAVKECPAYLQLIYNQITGKEPTGEEAERILLRNYNIISAEL